MVTKVTNKFLTGIEQHFNRMLISYTEARSVPNAKKNSRRKKTGYDIM